MHQEARRAFPVIAFKDTGMPIMDVRIHAATELLGTGALKNRNVIPQGPGKGVAVIYEWTELGIRMLIALHAVNIDRSRELRAQIASVLSQEIPPPRLRELPEDIAPKVDSVDMVESAKVDMTNDAEAHE